MALPSLKTFRPSPSRTLPDVLGLSGPTRQRLAPLADYPGGHAGAAGAAGPHGAVFDRAVRALSALGKGAVGTLAEMYVQGVSTRKVKAVTEALCGHSFSASSISAVNKSLDERLRAFAERRLDERYPYLILDARYEKVREAGIILSRRYWSRWRSTTTAGGRSWRLSSPTGRADRAGASFSRG